MSSEFEWDLLKAASNLQKHSVSFVEAATVFFDPLSITILDAAHPIDEQRFAITDCRISIVCSLWFMSTAVIESELLARD